MKKAMVLILVAIILWLGHRTEIDIGRCYDCYGNGKLYNGEPYFNYIKYDEDKVNENDIVLTVCFLNPLNNYFDDIICRFDKIILEDIPNEQ